MKSLSFALLAAACLSGCADLALPEPPVPGYVPANFRGEAKLPADVQRVALLPIHGGRVTEPESAQALDAVLLAALQRQQRFEVVVVSREDCRRAFGAESFRSTDALPHGMLEQIASKYAVDAVVFTDLTVFQPYRPIAIGLRSKLATVHDVRLLWTFDETFSASQENMVASVRQYYHHGDRSAPVDETPAVLQSPGRFGAVAADLMFRTLPPR